MDTCSLDFWKTFTHHKRATFILALQRPEKAIESLSLNLVKFTSSGPKLRMALDSVRLECDSRTFSTFLILSSCPRGVS
jgi:hypothetical protein